MADPIYRDRVTYRTGPPLPDVGAGSNLYQVNALGSVAEHWQVNAAGSITPDYWQVTAP